MRVGIVNDLALAEPMPRLRVALITYGALVKRSVDAANQASQQGVSVEVLDLRMERRARGGSGLFTERLAELLRGRRIEACRLDIERDELGILEPRRATR